MKSSPQPKQNKALCQRLPSVILDAKAYDLQAICFRMGLEAIGLSPYLRWLQNVTSMHLAITGARAKYSDVVDFSGS